MSRCLVTSCSVAALAVVLTSTAAGSLASPDVSVADGPVALDRPNIVFVTADDMRASDIAHLPNVQRLLAETGVTFRRSYASYPLCCPARTS